MVKKLMLLVLVAGLGWWYFIGGRTITEEQAHRFYEEELRYAAGMRDPKLHCELLHDDFQSHGVVSTAVGRMEDSQNKAQACEGYVELYKTFDSIGKRMGGIVQLDSKTEILGVQISPDKKRATVDISYALDVGGAIMNIRTRSTDTLVRRNGRVLMLRSEGTSTIGSGSPMR